MCPVYFICCNFFQAGRALVISVLDLTSSNPSSRLSNSEYRTLNGIKLWLRNYIKNEITKTPTSSSKTKERDLKVSYFENLYFLYFKSI